jgi:DNA-binding transcriptional MerR regulator
VSKFVSGLPISEVATRTGVSASTLRAWEERFGFPSVARLPGGHRRYDERDVERILCVVAERARGRSLAGAIKMVLDDPPASTEPSIYAAVRRLRPDLPVQVLSRRSMRAISNAIEDESRVHAEPPLLIALFQRSSAYALARGRWRALERTATAAIVFADFPRSRRPAHGPDEVALAPASPLHAEWSVICAASGFSACLAGWERPLRPNEEPGHQHFEAIWSVDPDVVEAVATMAAQIAQHQAPELYTSPPQVPAASSGSTAEMWRRVTALTNRIVGYLDQ